MKERDLAAIRSRIHTREQAPTTEFSIKLLDRDDGVTGKGLGKINDRFARSDGQPTNLFFLICCQDEPIHLHALARRCLLAQKANVLAQLREVPDAAALKEYLIAAEESVAASHAKTDKTNQHT